MEKREERRKRGQWEGKGDHERGKANPQGQGSDRKPMEESFCMTDINGEESEEVGAMEEGRANREGKGKRGLGTGEGMGQN